jgi:hypothetical protein
MIFGGARGLERRRGVAVGADRGLYPPSHRHQRTVSQRHQARLRADESEGGALSEFHRDGGSLTDESHGH